MTADAYQRAEAAAEAQRRAAGVRGVASSADGLVSAVVSAAGELLDLRIQEPAMRLGPAALGEAIVAAAALASADARRRGYTVLALALGDEAAAEVERSAAPEERPDPAVPPEEPEELSLFDPSVFRSDR